MVKSLTIRLIALIIIKNLNMTIIGLRFLTIISIEATRVVIKKVEFNGLYSIDLVIGIMITLTLFVRFLSYLSRAKIARKSRFNLVIIRIRIVLVISFRVRRFFLFFFFFERVLGPLLLLILG